jgi:deazaflavin-dependent oxidoreductase (nitroreductase family)
MVLPRRLRRLNRAGFNRLSVRVAPHLPGMGVVVHRGRRSGQTYRTPVLLFRDGAVDDGGEVVVALTYGADTDWVRNVLASDAAEVVTRGRTLRLASPRIVHDETRNRVPAPIRAALAVLRVDDFLVAGVADAPPAPR